MWHDWADWIPSLDVATSCHSTDNFYEKQNKTSSMRNAAFADCRHQYTSVDGDHNEHEVEKSELPKAQSQMNRINVNKAA